MLASERSDRSIRGRVLLSSNPRHCITLPRVLEKCCKAGRGEKLSLELEKFVPAFLRFKVCWEKSLRSIDYIQFFVLVESELLYFSPICFHRTWCKLMSHQEKETRTDTLELKSRAIVFLWAHLFQFLSLLGRARCGGWGAGGEGMEEVDWCIFLIPYHAN